ncbi:hypothetical protein BCR44DRAFT_1426260 [Catenaria anguillulae PL171]|uniref:Uncharacterized protein n=1 Tax=Catenaria anguillulae PL171 TaxID=765915 RepID=A0A1Y2HZS5_9FUNG|nr:hypothetical protein BCR44DRAFT_1426260 [Catenaria anguillulae PL171]
MVWRWSYRPRDWSYVQLFSLSRLHRDFMHARCHCANCATDCGVGGCRASEGRGGS